MHKEAGDNRNKYVNIPYWVWENSRKNGIRVSEWFDVEVEVDVELDLLTEVSPRDLHRGQAITWCVTSTNLHILLLYLRSRKGEGQEKIKGEKRSHDDCLSV